MSDEQTIRWFGVPWPRAELRAAVCEDDRFSIGIPFGETCEHCGVPFEITSRGVGIPGYALDSGKVGLSARLRFTWTYYHAVCFLAQVVGDAAAAELADRMEQA